MANSLLIRSPAIPTYAAREKSRLDPLVRAGTKFLFDLTRPQSHPDRTITPGSMAGKTITDLSGNNVPLTFGAGTSWTCNADGSVSNAAGTGSAEIGTDGQFNIAADPYDFLATYWFSISAGHLVSSLAYMFHLTHAGPASGQFALYLGGASGRKPVGFVSGEGAGPITSDVSLDEPHMIALHRSFSQNTLSFYVDGVKAWSIAATASLTTTAQKVLLSGVANRKTYRMSLVDMEASIAAETALGYNPNVILDADAHVLQEWRFCKGLIPEAPRTAFA